MALKKSAVLRSTASLARNNDWEFRQLVAPASSIGRIPDGLRALISPEELPKTEPTKITGSVAGYSISQQGRHKTGGSITLKVSENSDGEASDYFERLKALNNPRDSSGELTGQGVLEVDKEGEYSIVQYGADLTQIKKYILTHAVVVDCQTNQLSNSEEAEFVELTVTIDYKDHVIYNKDNVVIS